MRCSTAPRSSACGPPALNYVRVPALLSGLLFLVYFPLILVKADRNYFHSVGHHVEGYARNWLLLTAAFFLVSAIAYAARLSLGRSSRARHPTAR